jgi:hypothetical protein
LETHVQNNESVSIIARVSLAPVVFAMLAAWATLAITVVSGPVTAADGPAAEQPGAAQPPAKLANLGSTHALDILPLVERNVTHLRHPRRINLSPPQAHQMRLLDFVSNQFP